MARRTLLAATAAPLVPGPGLAANAATNIMVSNGWSSPTDASDATMTPDQAIDLLKRDYDTVLG